MNKKRYVKLLKSFAISVIAITPIAVFAQDQTVFTVNYNNIPANGIKIQLVFFSAANCYDNNFSQAYVDEQTLSPPKSSISYTSTDLTNYLGGPQKGCFTLKVMCSSNNQGPILSYGFFNLESFNVTYTRSDPNNANFDISQCNQGLQNKP